MRASKHAGATRFDPDRFLSAVTLRQIRYFVAAAECGKVNAAASMVAISPSAVTEAIGELESLSGAQLFLRHPRGLSLTYEGHRFLAHCRNVLASVKDAAYAFGRPDNVPDGAFSLAVTNTISGYFIGPLLMRFKRAFPNINVRLTEESRVSIEEGVIAGKHDLGLLLTSNLQGTPLLSTYTLIQSMRRLWLSAKHPLLKHDVITFEDIANEPYIQLMTDGADQSTLRYWQQHRLEPNIVFRTHSMEAVRSLIAFGHGVTILSDLMYRPWSLEGDRVEVRELYNSIPTMNAGVVWRRGTIGNLAAATFMNFCRTEYSPTGPGAVIEARP